ncbi:MAG: hypothetical protein ACLQDL_13480 [Spirochaetia bacterium]
MRITAVAAAALSLAGCFVFDSPYDRTPSITQQIVVQAGSSTGTYIWNPADSAYETTIGGVPCSVYIDSSGTWHMTYGAGNIVASSTGTYSTLPPTTPAGWSGTVAISSIDDSEGGVSIQGQSPDARITGANQVLQVAFTTSSPGNGATYVWQKSPIAKESFTSPVTVGTGNTYAIQDTDYSSWFRVIATPTDSTGTIVGTPVASQPVGWP